MQEINKFIGGRIRELRDAVNMTQKELGDLLSYSPMAISHFEKGIRDIRPADLQKIAQTFKKELSYFFPTANAPAHSTTLFRADGVDHQAAQESLESFDKFLESRHE